MARGKAAGPGSGRITSGIIEGKLGLEIAQYVRDKLPDWRDDPDRPDADSENRLNAQLCKYLDSHARNERPMIRFDIEEYQSGQRRADLSASLSEGVPLKAQGYTIHDPILIIECKRLPAPKRNREKEYVSSGTDRKISGGIQRFKLGLHGGQDRLAVLVGYVQREDRATWHARISHWIGQFACGELQDTCCWNKEETLVFLEEDGSKGCGSYRSSHRRTGAASMSTIEIMHLWISMNPADASEEGTLA
jgi:hypothetical protein